MATLRAIDGGTLRTLLTTLQNTTWNWASSDVSALAGQLGWDVLEIVEGKGAFADAAWDAGGEEIEFALNGERVNDIIMRLTDTATSTDIDAQASIQDSFTGAVATATEVLGQPDSRTAGKRPEVRWRGENATILLKNLGVTVSLVWASNTWQDHWDQLRGDNE